MSDSLIVQSLVIGGGIAGLRAALELSRYGEVVIVNKGSPMEGSSGLAQGGVAAALEDAGDIDAHYQDTLNAGRGLCRENAVRVLVEEGPERVRELISWGARFDQLGEKFIFAREAAHQKERILRAKGDSTGEEIMQTLLKQVQLIANISRLDHMLGIDLILYEGQCIGVFFLDEKTQRPRALFSKVTVLATGGLGQLYLRTTNPLVATGDGMAMSARAGAYLEDMEFVQFHPTSLILSGAPPFLLSEAMRGEGAVLRNKEGRAFMPDYHPQADLAPRDVVARGILQEMEKTGSPNVFLDARQLPGEYLKERFPRIFQTCLSYGLDITKQLVPIAPSMHFMMGGVQSSIEGAASIDGLFTAGEVACAGIHGANRLASNSLLEGLVFGKKVGEYAGETSTKRLLLPSEQLEKMKKGLLDKEIGPQIPASGLSQARSDLQKIMWEGAGIIRDHRGIKRVLSFIQEWEWVLKGTYQTGPEIELKNLFLLGKMIAEACLLREESVGAHFRADSKTQNNLRDRHILLKWDQSNCTVESRISS